MDERLKRIRESERKSHVEIYTDEKLYATDSWLKKPIKTVREYDIPREGFVSRLNTNVVTFVGRKG